MPARAIGACAVAGLISAATAADEAATSPNLTADQIVEENGAARGGLEAWRKIRTMIWTGHIETGKPSAPIVPFVLEYKRPNKMRFEINAEREKSLRVFDGVSGWKVGASSAGMPTATRPYSALELRSARDAQGIDGLLIDHRAKGIDVASEGTDEVEGHAAYRLSVTLPSGAKRHLWVDAHTFLELKYERGSHTPPGGAGTVSVYYRNYRTVEGLQMPRVIETGAGAGKAPEQMVVDNVTLNPSLSDAHFERPATSERRKAPPGLRSESPASGSVPHAMEYK
jgi:outer membrane lipoprotein-sorting protein